LIWLTGLARRPPFCRHLSQFQQDYFRLSGGHLPDHWRLMSWGVRKQIGIGTLNGNDKRTYPAAWRAHGQMRNRSSLKKICSVDFPSDINLHGKERFLASGHFTRDDPCQVSGHLLVFLGT
jgi:hypothetical protein